MAAETMLYRAGRTLLGLYSQVMMQMDIAWHAPLPEGPKIIAANHPTTIDPAWIYLLEPDHMSILITEMVFNIPAFGRYVAHSGHICVRLSDGHAAFQTALRRLRAGRTIAIFPEGVLSPEEGGTHRPRTGVARLALLSGAPVIPVGIHVDSTYIRSVETTVNDLTDTARWYVRGPYAMTVGAPVSFEGSVEDRAQVMDIAERIMGHIGVLAEESAARMARMRRPALASILWGARPAETGQA
jgi:1-acyl-sn-glycerol-3-phosphate acyltransferase